MDPCESSYTFEPQVAEHVFEDMTRESGILFERSVALLDVAREGSLITNIVTSRGELHADVFIDASYEGDLMALAGVPYRIGREPLRTADPSDADELGLQEDHAGIQPFRLPRGVHIDPYRVPGDPTSGTIRFVDPRPERMPELGDGDSRVMAYNYRLCVTDDPANRIPFARPEGYDPEDVEGHARLAAAAAPDDFVRSMFNVTPTARSPYDPSYYKYDLNGGFSLSTDLTGDDLNHAYVEASETDRERIERVYRNYIESLLYAWRTDARFGALNERVAEFGYCADEFTDRGGWPHQLYVRAGRRMIGEYTMNENDLLQNARREPISDAIAFGSYAMGTHAHRHLAAPMQWPNGALKDTVVMGGIVIVPIPDSEPYPIAYRSITPRAEDARNLLNPVTLSATNLAYSSIRMEPTFMMLGEAAGTAAVLSAESGVDVQEVDYGRLRRRLLEQGQRLPR